MEFNLKNGGISKELYTHLIRSCQKYIVQGKMALRGEFICSKGQTVLNCSTRKVEKHFFKKDQGHNLLK